MTNPNMICPKCKTFQPAAPTCQSCGVIVAKLWARESPPPASPRPSPAPRLSRTSLVAALAATALAAVGFGLWLAGSEPNASSGPEGDTFEQMRQAWELAQDAQSAAENHRQRMEDAFFQANYGEPGSIPGSPARALERVVIDREAASLARDFNSVSTTDLVELTASDIAPTYARCANSIERQFPPLRYGARETYPIPVPTSVPIGADELPGRFRCEGARGTIYTNQRPRQRDGVEQCWARHTPRSLASARRGQASSEPPVWLKMRWDGEADRWSVYTRADQRKVDQGRMEKARREILARTEQRYARTQERARARVPALYASIEQARESLRILSDETNRNTQRAILERKEHELRRALVEQRSIQICREAVSAALDARQVELAAR